MTSRTAVAVTGACIAAGGLALACAGAPPPPPSRPNVLLVLIDTLRADHLRMYGYDRETAPFLTRWAADGAAVFLDARSQAGCTFPAVNSLLTSSDATAFLETMAQHGWGIPEAFTSLPELLQETGYRTFAVSASPIVRDRPGPQNPDGGFGAGFDRFDDSCEREAARCVNRQALALLEEVEPPFFGYLHYFDPHDPYQPPAEHRRRFALGDHPVPWVADGSLLPLYRSLYTGGPEVEFGAEDLAYALALYDEEIAYLDTQLEALFDELALRGLLDDTLIVLAADHGEAFQEHGDFFHCKDLTSDNVVRTPLVIRPPRGSAAQNRIHGAAQNLDIMPTVLDYAGITTDLPMRGISLRPALGGEPLPDRDVFVSQRHARAVVSGRFKLGYHLLEDRVAMFDLRSDPGELVDIVARRPAVATRLLGKLSLWMAEAEPDSDRSRQLERAEAASQRLRALGYLQ